MADFFQPMLALALLLMVSGSQETARRPTTCGPMPWGGLVATATVGAAGAEASAASARNAESCLSYFNIVKDTLTCMNNRAAPLHGRRFRRFLLGPSGRAVIARVWFP